MAGLLERLDGRPLTAGAGQYRDVARRIADLLGQVEPDEHLHALLDAAPAAAEIYENLRYRHAGLCRAPLEAALNAELAASAAIAHAAGRR